MGFDSLIKGLHNVLKYRGLVRNISYFYLAGSFVVHKDYSIWSNFGIKELKRSGYRPKLK